jgi:hypothetical protein
VVQRCHVVMDERERESERGSEELGPCSCTVQCESQWYRRPGPAAAQWSYLEKRAEQTVIERGESLPACMMNLYQWVWRDEKAWRSFQRGVAWPGDGKVKRSHSWWFGSAAFETES